MNLFIIYVSHKLFKYLPFIIIGQKSYKSKKSECIQSFGNPSFKTVKYIPIISFNFIFAFKIQSAQLINCCTKYEGFDTALESGFYSR